MVTTHIQLSDADKRAILRAADEIIGEGGRTLLAKILKGSREKKILQLGLDQCPTYGYFRSETIANITKKVDWMIDFDFLDIEYFGKLPMIVFTDRGWFIESDQRADEFISEWDQWLDEGHTAPDMTYLKDRNREVILLLLEKLAESKDKKYIPYLKEWQKIDYKKVSAKIEKTIHAIESSDAIDDQNARKRQASINQALAGSRPQDLRITCWECGEHFTFTVGEQQFYKQKGFVHPKRCPECREERDRDFYF